MFPSCDSAYATGTPCLPPETSSSKRSTHHQLRSATNDVACGFTRVQSAHSWRSLRVAPSGDYAIVSVGADCNWPCEANEPTDLQTTLVRIDLQSGSASVAATGIRNAIGLHFLPNGDMLFSAFGSDNGQGIPGGGNGRNVPDCELNVLRR